MFYVLLVSNIDLSCLRFILMFLMLLEDIFVLRMMFRIFWMLFFILVNFFLNVFFIFVVLIFRVLLIKYWV